MAELTAPDLSGVAETLLIPLYVRAIESQRPDALIRDPKAVELVKRIHYDFQQVRMQSHDEVAVLLRLRKFDQLACDFLRRNPQGAVVHIGCGLDTRFERVDNGQVEWYDLDLPEVIALRQKLIGGESGRCHSLACSVFDFEWMQRVGDVQRPFLFLAEGVLSYFEEDQVKALVLAIRDQFPRAEMACDAMTPFAVRMNNLQLSFSRIKARLHWALKQGRDPEGWAPGIVLMDEWFFFDDPEPRMAPFRWMKWIPNVAKSAGIFHYRLGQEARMSSQIQPPGEDRRADQRTDECPSSEIAGGPGPSFFAGRAGRHPRHQPSFDPHAAGVCGSGGGGNQESGGAGAGREEWKWISNL